MRLKDEETVVDTMVRQGSGVILNASSIAGLYGNFGQTSDAASKFGVMVSGGMSS